MVVRKYLTVLSGKYPANIPGSAGCLTFTGYRYPDPAHPYRASKFAPKFMLTILVFEINKGKNAQKVKKN